MGRGSGTTCCGGSSARPCHGDDSARAAVRGWRTISGTGLGYSSAGSPGRAAPRPDMAFRWTRRAAKPPRDACIQSRSRDCTSSRVPPPGCHRHDMGALPDPPHARSPGSPSIGSWIVCSEDLIAFRLPCATSRPADQVRLRARGPRRAPRCSRDVEVAQRRAGQHAQPVHPVERALDEQLGVAIGVGRRLGMVLVDPLARVLGIAVGRRGALRTRTRGNAVRVSRSSSTMRAGGCC